ncbi:hypothetical protein [Serinicoccus sediminis]|uniref:hypothetical protein n=1 Tax=Serinicoccus sediminis TaxID=2306021 RepID=UPI001021A69C|nr:hypothetical protein [Serinicoccus sediminis]
MRRLWTWIVVILVVGLLLSLPSVSLWRPTPSTPVREGLFALAGFTSLASSLLLGLGAAMTGLALAVRWDVVRLPPGGPAERAALVGGGLVAAGLVLQVLLGAVAPVVALSLLVVGATAVLHGAGVVLLALWLVGRCAPAAAGRVDGVAGPVSDQSHPR